MKESVQLLYVEDDSTDQRAFLRMVKEQDLSYEVTIVPALAAARALLAERRFDLIVTDYHLPDGHGTELFEEVQETPFILLTGTLEEELAIRTLARGADDYLTKTADMLHLRAMPLTIQKTLYRYHLREAELRLTQELRNSQEALREANRGKDEALATLREADRRKDEFLAILGHELRNPLAAIRTALQACERDPAALVWAIGVVDRQSAQLGRLVDDLLDVSRIVQGKVILRDRPVDLAPLLKHAADTVAGLMEQKRHTFNVELEESKGLVIHGDPARLEQIVVNLLTNAAKYTESGGTIWLKAAQLGQRKPGMVEIRVRDTGMGIRPEKLPSMFEPFTQAERSIGRSQGGLGLGLVIVKRLVEMHGGTVEGHSAGLGKGSEFIVRLPRVKSVGEPSRTPEEPLTPEPQALKPARVLVVDDNEDAAQGLERLVKRWGCTTELAFDGEMALEKAREFNPEVVLLDIGLPGRDGCEVAAQLRQMPCCRESTLIAITGYGQEEDRRRSEQAGFDYHLIKPVDTVGLKGMMAAGCCHHQQ